MRDRTDDSSAVKLPRRRLLEAAVVGVLAGGSAIAIARTRGYQVPPGRRLMAFAPWQFVVVEHAARRIAAPDREHDPSIPSADDLEVAAFVDTWMARLPDRLRHDLGRFLAYVEHVAPLGAGMMSRFTRLRPGDQDRVLASIQGSSSDLLRAGFDGLRSLVFLGYYRDPRTWHIVGYDGPLVGRPRSGWQ
jgi:Gluconate 2-dehydrogenase subunit 3